MTGAEIGGVSLATAIVLLGAAVGAVVALTFFVAIVKGFLYICRPNEILIFSGRKHTLPSGSSKARWSPSTATRRPSACMTSSAAPSASR